MALVLLSTAVMLGMVACGGKKPEKETTQAVATDMTEKAEATTEKAEESSEETKTETESALKVINQYRPCTSYGESGKG